MTGIYDVVPCPLANIERLQGQVIGPDGARSISFMHLRESGIDDTWVGDADGDLDFATSPAHGGSLMIADSVLRNSVVVIWAPPE